MKPLNPPVPEMPKLGQDTSDSKGNKETTIETLLNQRTMFVNQTMFVVSSPNESIQFKTQSNFEHTQTVPRTLSTKYSPFFDFKDGHNIPH